MNLDSYNITFEEVDNLKPRVAILPIGSFEQHGSHLPMTTDTIIATAISDAISKSIDVLLLPPITITCSQEHNGFFGSTFISSKTLSHIIVDIVDSLKFSDINSLVLVNGHGGNYVIKNVAQELNNVGNKILVFPTSQHWKQAIVSAYIETSLHEDMHAGEIETSILLHLNPDLVRENKMIDELASNRSFLHLLGMKGYTKSGVIGVPTLANKEKGKLLLESLAKSAIEDINSFCLKS